MAGAIHAARLEFFPARGMDVKQHAGHAQNAVPPYAILLVSQRSLEWGQVMTHHVDITEAPRRLLDLIQAVEHGEEVIITRNQQPLVQLVPLPQPANRPQFGSARGARVRRAICVL